jgi:hypothetical protein
MILHVDGRVDLGNPAKLKQQRADLAIRSSLDVMMRVDHSAPTRLSIPGHPFLEFGSRKLRPLGAASGVASNPLRLFSLRRLGARDRPGRCPPWAGIISGLLGSCPSRTVVERPLRA